VQKKHWTYRNRAGDMNYDEQHITVK